ncbi:MAG: hypothetical protein HC830_07685, partial [Bacteroidetes bacterium]|nr:hypothetical protein [Bacteroidota bacterium]
NQIIHGYEKSILQINTPNLINRKETLSSFTGSAGIKLDISKDRWDIHSDIIYHIYQSGYKLYRSDFNHNNDANHKLNFSVERKEQRINWNSHAKLFDAVYLDMTHDFSANNRYRNSKIIYSPTAGLGVDLANIFHWGWRINFMKLKASWGYNFNHVPLHFAFGRYNFQQLNSAEYLNATFGYEIFPDFALKPEKIMKKNIGLDMGFWGNKLEMNIDYYQNLVGNAIFPVTGFTGPVLDNVGQNRVRGIDAEIIFRQNAYGWSSQYKLIFTHYRSKVLELNNHEKISLAGFADIHTALVEGYSAGVIVGTAWKRDDNGNMIIGNDGFPEVDNHLKVLANPEPDFVLGFESTFYIRSFTFSILSEYRRGGKIWNGTRNVLSYYGLSNESLKGRSIKEYVYPGVYADGSINTTPVDFANPSLPLEQNRWYRYGITGVAEDAIEDASCFRIREITIGYKKHINNMILEFLLFTRNPLLVCSFDGSDPAISLWEQSNTAGMQLFAMPSVTSTGLTIKFTL